jgi:hypothetical protein
MIDDKQLIKLLAERAEGYLDYDDAHPDVGMGMGIWTAITYAEKDVVKEAARWNSMEALALDQARFDRVRERVKQAVNRARGR